MGVEAIHIPGDETSPAVEGHAILPSGARRGVVVLHDLFGVQPETLRVVERFARAGYAAVAPNLFASGSRIGCVRSIVRAAARGDGPPARAVVRARRWIEEHAGLSTSAVGLIGFCLTGGFVLGVGRGWGAISSNYGDVPPTERLRGIGPVIGCYGGRDIVFRKNAELLRDRLADANVPGEVHLFPSAGHSFLTDGEHPLAETLTRPFFSIRYDAAVADEAWSKILTFFDRHLAG